MRFFADGPNIPDNLLIARDQGRVVYFCGAGVSRARAGLPDFFGLAEAVIDKLGVSSEGPARKILGEAKGLYERTGEGGLISADRIFGLLERDFDFFGLAEAVIDKLGVSSEGPARKILGEAKGLYERTGEGGLISADRIFGRYWNVIFDHRILKRK